MDEVIAGLEMLNEGNIIQLRDKYYICINSINALSLILSTLLQRLHVLNVFSLSIPLTDSIFGFTLSLLLLYAEHIQNYFHFLISVYYHRETANNLPNDFMKMDSRTGCTWRDNKWTILLKAIKIRKQWEP